MSYKKLIDLATDPEQYSHGEATSWLADENRQKEQQERFFSAIKQFIPPSCHSALDIGCGTGWTAEGLFLLGVRQYVGIEPSLKNYEIAKREHPDLAILQKTFENYRADSSFDCALAIMMLSHIRNIDAGFEKIYRLLSDGGRFISIFSAFHLESDRYERNGRRYEVEVIDEAQYIDRSIGGTSYGIADINRHPDYYIQKATEKGFTLITHTTIDDKGYSPKELLVFQKSSNVQKRS